uniref:lysozyme n=1 Tax=Glossina palpalis gambiensis TaxID=67801 RepID=A0A1B0BRB0_9MUSC
MPLTKQQKHRLIIISAVIISLFLITASIYMHIRQKPHLGRMRHDNGRSMTNQNTEYVTCARNRICSEQTINSYMQRYSRDCNQDGIIDCQDYIALQMLGQNGCMRQQMSATHISLMNECLKQHLQK